MEGRIIYLDIDDVLNTNSDKPREITPLGYTGIYNSKLKILKQIIDLTGAKIILSSTWREFWDKDYDKCDIDGKYLTDKFKEFDLIIDGKVPRASGIHRGREILDHVNKNNIKSWIVIDDYSFPDFKECGIVDTGKMPRWLKVGLSNGGGLQEKHIERALWLFLNQEKENN